MLWRRKYDLNRFKNIHKSNLANARTSEMSEKVPESSITLAEIYKIERNCHAAFSV